MHRWRARDRKAAKLLYRQRPRQGVCAVLGMRLGWCRGGTFRQEAATGGEREQRGVDGASEDGHAACVLREVLALRAARHVYYEGCWSCSQPPASHASRDPMPLLGRRCRPPPLSHDFPTCLRSRTRPWRWRTTALPGSWRQRAPGGCGANGGWPFHFWWHHLGPHPHTHAHPALMSPHVPPRALQPPHASFHADHVTWSRGPAA